MRTAFRNAEVTPVRQTVFMQSVPSRFTLPRVRNIALAGVIVALSLAGFAAARGLSGSCPAQVEAMAQAQPGLVLMAGEVTDPACTGKHRLRR